MARQPGGPSIFPARIARAGWPESGPVIVTTSKLDDVAGGANAPEEIRKSVTRLKTEGFVIAAQVTKPNQPVVWVVGADGSGLTPCDDGEQVLDIVNSIGMAPGVSEVLFYEGDNGADILNQIATDNLAKIISCSWGSGSLGGDDVLFQEFQAQGQTYVNATGDSGAYNAQAWLPPSLNPLVLQVGGTHLRTTGGGGPYASERGWSGSGGGLGASIRPRRIRSSSSRVVAKGPGATSSGTRR